MQPLQGEEQTYSGKKEKAADEEKWQDKTEDLPVTGVGRVIITGEERSIFEQPEPGQRQHYCCWQELAPDTPDSSAHNLGHFQRRDQEQFHRAGLAFLTETP